MNQYLPRLHFTSQKFSLFLSVIVMSLGFIVLFGWYSHNTTLIQVHPSFVAMQYNTALGFLLSGITLLLSLWQRHYWAAFLGVIVLLIGGLTLIEYISRLDLGIDQLFMQHYVTTQASQPGRMAPNTALCFFLSGIVLTTINLNQRLSLLSLLGSVVTGLGLIAFLGYIFGLETAYGWGHLTRMAVHTSAGFILLGIGISFWKLNSDTESKEVNSLKKMSLVAISLLVVIIATWQALNDQDDKKIRQDVARSLNEIQGVLEVRLTSTIEALERMALRWKERGGTPYKEWESDAQSYIDNSQVFQAIEWVDNTFHVRWIVPLAGNEVVQGVDLSLGESRLESLMKAKEQDITTLSPPISLKQGGNGFLIDVPLSVNQQFDGFILGVIRTDKIFSILTETTGLKDHFKIKLYDGEALVAGNTESFNQKESNYLVNSELIYKNLAWRVEMSPREEYIASLKSPLPNIIFFSGLFLIAILLIIYYLYSKANFSAGNLRKEILKRERITEELTLNEERLQATLESMVDAVIMIDKKGSILSFNKAARHIFGYSSEEVMRRNVKMLMPEPFHSNHDAYLQNYLAGGDAKVIGIGREVMGRRANGDTFPMSLAVSEVKTKKQHLFSGIVRDLSVQKRSESVIDRYTNELERSNKELDDFAYVASHDLKAPLRGVMQLVSWIEEDIEGKLDEQTKEYIDLLHNRVNRMEKLLDDLLSYARIGRKHGDFETIDVAKVAHEIFLLLSPPSGFKLVCEKDLPTFITLSVPFELVLRNLIHNAIKHHDRDSGTITVAAKAIDDGFEFIVSDDGPGIVEEHHERVFGIFQTLKPRDEVEGSGIGLAIIKKLLSSFQCHIKIVSTGERGSQFHFIWPAEEKLRRLIDE